MTPDNLTTGEKLSALVLGSLLGGLMVALLSYTGWLQ